MFVFLALAGAWANAMIASPVVPHPVAPPAQIVLSDLQNEQIEAFTNLVLGRAGTQGERADLRRDLRDMLIPLAAIEPALRPYHRYEPVGSNLDRRVTRLADEFVEVLNDLRAKTTPDRQLASRALVILACLHLAAGANAGRPEDWTMRVYGGGMLLLAGSAVTIAIGLTWPSDLFFTKGFDGAVIGVAIGFLGQSAAWVTRAQARLRGIDPHDCRAVADHAHAVFWTRVAAATDWPADAGSAARVAVGHLDHPALPLARACEVMLGRGME